jgi:nitrite reductase/ring-hydroxylating ferredoxin subunit
VAEWIEVARLEEVPPDGPKCVAHGDKRIALFRAGDRVYALEDFCPHVGAKLSEGRREQLTVECPWHHVVYSLSTGAALSQPNWGPAHTFPVRVVDGAIEIDWSKRRYPAAHR